MTTFGKRTHGIEVKSGREALGRDRPKGGSIDKLFIAVCAVVTVVTVALAVAAPSSLSGDVTLETERPVGLP